MTFNRSLSYAVDALTDQIEAGHPRAKQLRKARGLILTATMDRQPWWMFWRNEH